jgi:hypothetical protein
LTQTSKYTIIVITLNTRRGFNMHHTYSSQILTQLLSSGFTVEKNEKESQWQLKDDSEILAWSKSLGDLTRKSAKDLGID